MTKFRLQDRRGAIFALAAAGLFGSSMPFAKLLLHDVSPELLAGLLYVGSGLGLMTLRALRPAGKGEASLARNDHAHYPDIHHRHRHGR